ncbi:MAG: hypothetical protein WCB68_16690 [Pyrinomonadaceae bacterium]
MSKQPPNSKNRTRGIEPDATEELISRAREYFASDFPNPERGDCPASGSWSARVQAGLMPDEKLRAHLFSCSECFGEYRTAMLARESEAPARATAGWTSPLAALFTRFRAPIFAGAVALVLLALAGFYLWQGRKQENAPIVARNNPVPDAPANNNAQSNPAVPVTTPSLPLTSTIRSEPSPPIMQPAPTLRQTNPSPRQRSGEQNGRELVAMKTVTVDLEQYTALRDVEESNGAPGPIILAAQRTRLKLKLAEGSLAGPFTISVVDEADKARATTRARSSTGTDLSVILNLAKLPPGKYRLYVRRDGEAPSYYPVVVEK